MKRILLFVATNVAVLVVLSIALQLLGIESLLARNGTQLDLQSLLIFSAIVGFAGSFISLAMSKWTAKYLTGARVIETPSNAAESRRLAEGKSCAFDPDSKAQEEAIRKPVQQGVAYLDARALYEKAEKMPDGPAAGEQGVGDQPAMAAVREGFGTHDGRSLLAGGCR